MTNLTGFLHLKTWCAVPIVGKKHIYVLTHSPQRPTYIIDDLGKVPGSGFQKNGRNYLGAKKLFSLRRNYGVPFRVEA
ncbi:MAG: hypothetical protein R3B84_01925 [Zavarzinella sp.]